jgi:hypothetical protein
MKWARISVAKTIPGSSRSQAAERNVV